MFHQVCTLWDRVSELLQYLKKNFTGDSFKMFVVFEGRPSFLVLWDARFYALGKSWDESGRSLLGAWHYWLSTSDCQCKTPCKLMADLCCSRAHTMLANYRTLGAATVSLCSYKVVPSFQMVSTLCPAPSIAHSSCGRPIDLRQSESDRPC